MRISNLSEEQWLEQRRGVLTATDIARIAGSAAEAARVREEKRTGRTGFHGNRYTEWGKLNEPLIYQRLCEAWDSDFEHNHDLWVSDQDPRFGATPDMVLTTPHGVKYVGEIKTVLAHNDWGGGAIPRRYMDQVQWQMLVTGAEKCLFGWEPYEDRDGEFVAAGAMQSRWIARDEARIEQLVEITERWFAGMKMATGQEQPASSQ